MSTETSIILAAKAANVALMAATTYLFVTLEGVWVRSWLLLSSSPALPLSPCVCVVGGGGEEVTDSTQAGGGRSALIFDDSGKTAD